MIEAIWVAFAFVLGMLVRKVGLPPLVGYLAAGFALNMSSPYLGLPKNNGEMLHHIAHLGVLVLLFTVGLKLKLKSLIRPEVIGGGLMHCFISAVFFFLPLYFWLSLDARTALLLAVALSFSSTVLAAKVLESKRELRAFHGRTAIGILIVQDLIALFVMSVAGGSWPSPWALLVLLLPFLRPALHRLLDASDHDELLLLLGLLLALAVGGYGFESVGLSSELGALLLGAMLASHPRAKEMSDALWGIKEVLLVGFFLQIGIDGLPDGQAFVLALVLALLLPLKGFLFYLLLIGFRLRARSAFLTSLSLTNYSEFGLIVVSVVLPEWIVPLALTVALSFVVSAPLNRLAHPLYERFAPRLSRFERNLRHPDEQPISLGETEVLIFGMGRTGSAAYDHLKKRFNHVVGLDSDMSKLDGHAAQGREVFFADAEDPVFWERLAMNNVKAVVLAMNDIEAKLIAARKLRAIGFEGLVVSHTFYPDEADAIRSAGADHAYLTFCEAGVGLAERICGRLSYQETAHDPG